MVQERQVLKLTGPRTSWKSTETSEEGGHLIMLMKDQAWYKSYFHELRTLILPSSERFCGDTKIVCLCFAISNWIMIILSCLGHFLLYVPIWRLCFFVNLFGIQMSSAFMPHSVIGTKIAKIFHQNGLHHTIINWSCPFLGQISIKRESSNVLYSLIFEILAL